MGGVWFDLKPRESITLLQSITELTEELADVFELDPGATTPIDELLERAEAERQRQALIDPLGNEADAVDLDPVTNLPNRSRFLREFETAYSSARDVGRSLGLVLVSVDDGRRLVGNDPNDARGRILTGVAALLRSTLNQKAPLYRFVGAEFIGVLEGASPTIASQVGEFLRQRVEGSPIRFEHGDGSPGTEELTITVGVAAIDLERDNEDAVPPSPDALLQSAMCAVANRPARRRERAGARWCCDGRRRRRRTARCVRFANPRVPTVCFVVHLRRVVLFGPGWLTTEAARGHRGPPEGMHGLDGLRCALRRVLVFGVVPSASLEGTTGRTTDDESCVQREPFV